MDTPVWDRFGRARSPAEVLADLQAPPPVQQPQAIVVPRWMVDQGVAKLAAEMHHPALHSLRSGIADADGVPPASERMATVQQNQKIEKLRAASRAGSKEAAVAWAKELFPNGIGKPDHGPEHY